MMRSQTNWLLICLFFGLSPQVQGALDPDLSINWVTDLPALEVYQGQTFHQGLLWVGKSRTADHDKHQVEVYSPDGLEKLASIDLDTPEGRNHSASHIHPYDQDSVIVTGRSQWPWKTHYSILSYSQGKITAEAYTFPEKYQVDQFGGSRDQMFFTEVGDGTILQHHDMNQTALRPRISGPGKMLMIDNFLLTIERKSFYQGDENVVSINLETQQATRLFSNHRAGIVDMADLGDYRLGIAEMKADQVVVMNLKSQTLTHTLSVPGPGAVEKFGKHCAVAASEEQRSLHFFDLRQDHDQEIARWELASLGTKFRKARQIHVNPDNGQIYLRSTYLCTGCNETMSSVVTVRQKSANVWDRCR